MLSDRHYQLLTAYVDGEIDDRDRQAVLRLIQESPEAQALLIRLQEDSKRVQRLPRASVDADFTTTVMNRIKRPVVTRAPRYSAVRWAIAATILIAGGVTTWLVLNSTNEPAAQPQIAQGPKQRVVEKKNVDSKITEMFQGAFAAYGEPVPEIGKRLAFNDPQLAKELATAPEAAVHLEIRCQSSMEVVGRLQAFLSAKGVKLWHDPRLEQDVKRQDYVIFAENLPPQEVAALVAKISNNQFDSVLFNPLEFEHRQELAALLGVSAFRIEQSRFDPVPVPRDPEELGIGQNGKPVRPKASIAPRTPVPDVERQALIIPWAPGEGRGIASDETRRFLNGRRGNRPGTLQVVIVLHQAI